MPTRNPLKPRNDRPAGTRRKRASRNAAFVGQGIAELGRGLSRELRWRQDGFAGGGRLLAARGRARLKRRRRRGSRDVALNRARRCHHQFRKLGLGLSGAAETVPKQETEGQKPGPNSWKRRQRTHLWGYL
jgi:hypothetical protein